VTGRARFGAVAGAAVLTVPALGGCGDGSPPTDSAPVSSETGGASTTHGRRVRHDRLGHRGHLSDPSAVAVDGDTATVIYDVLFGGTAADEDLTGTMSMVDGTWVVSRTELCSFMASARTPCP
jgi:hypothetical protein